MFCCEEGAVSTLAVMGVGKKSYAIMSLDMDEKTGSLKVLKRLKVNSVPGVILILLVNRGQRRTLISGCGAFVGVDFTVTSFATNVQRPFLFSIANITTLSEPGLTVSGDSSSSNSVFIF